MTNYDQFRQGYMTCLEWLTINSSDWQLDQMTETDGETFRQGYSETMWLNNEAEWIFSNEALKQIEADCISFYNANVSNLDLACELSGYTYNNAGHDLWLTRNYHGAGFWDRGLGTVGDVLTALAEAEGEVGVYLGDDGLVYIE